MAFSFQSGMKGRSTEALEQCPYEKCHNVSVKKFNAHLLACRRNFKLKQLKKRGHIDVFVCQYNPNHLVYSSELIFHESRCEDREVIHSYQMNFALKDIGLNFDFGLTDFAQNLKELANIFQGIDIGMIQGCEHYGKKFKFEDIKYPKRAAQCQAQEKELKIERTEKEGDRPKIEQNINSEDMAEFEYWNKFTAGPGFDYMKAASVHKSDQAWLKFLTKAERKEFEKKNTGLFEKLEKMNLKSEEISEEKANNGDDQIPGSSRNAHMEGNKSSGPTQEN